MTTILSQKINDPSPADAMVREMDRITAASYKTELKSLRARAGALDDYFRRSFEISAVGPQMRVDRNPYAIVALGGYGRREQCEASDVDVLFLFEKSLPKQATNLIQEAVYPLWDLGMEVGHATRTIKECAQLAAKDFEVLTSIIDARFVCGMSPLYSRLMERIHEKVLKGSTKNAYLKWLAQGIQDRSEQFGDSTFLLEPNLKRGLGGLRDYHVMLWIARVTHEARDPRDLEYMGLLTHDEYASLTQALDFIWKVRNQLHILAKRKCDQLYFEYQPKLAEALGFTENEGLEGIEHFLKTLHHAMGLVKRRNRAFMLSAMPRPRPGRPAKAVRPTKTPGIIIKSGALAFESPSQLANDPALLMGIFTESSRTGAPLGIEAIRLIGEFSQLIDDSFRSSTPMVRAFERILTSSKSFVLEEMFSTGFITAFIPELAGVVDRIQYTHYHVYPVDRHLMKAVETAKSFGGGDPETDLCARLYGEISSKKILLWAVLLHDVGKGVPEGGHSVRGAVMARNILTRMGFKQDQIDTVFFLVKEHLFLAKTATRRDLHDEGTSIACARKVRNSERLKMLYLLTVADSMATGPKAWNDWTASLLMSLFVKTHQVLTKGELATAREVASLKEKKKFVLKTAPKGMGKKWIELYDIMSPRYLHDIAQEDIVKHIRLYEKLQDSSAIIEAAPETDTGLRSVTVCAKDKPGLFSRIAGVLTLHNLNIFNAQIYTWRNHTAMDVFQVTPPLDPLNERRTWGRVERDLKKALAGDLDLDESLKAKLAAARPEADRAAPKEEKVNIDNDTSGFFTIIEVFAYDRPGLLYAVTDALYRCGLDIWVAKIATKADQVVDVFYVRDFDSQKILEDSKIQSIRESVLQTLGGNGSGIELQRL